MTKTALEQLDELIGDLEARLNLAPGSTLEAKESSEKNNNKQGKKKEKKPKQQTKKKEAAKPPADQPEICKLEFKVGKITKVWVHPDADKLYCEEIDCGEEAPRQIASGLRPYYTEDQMLGQRLLVVANLKAKNLVGFKSHGMVLCAAGTNEDGSDKVEFIEPPEVAPLGEVVTFEGLPTPFPVSGSQVDKKKVFQKAMEGMKTNDECMAAWNGHVFMTSAGPCKSTSIAGGPMR